MARKNILAGLMKESEEFPAIDKVRDDPPRRNTGALGAVTRSIDALAQKAAAANEIEKKLVAGEVVIELDTSVVDSSFITDRVQREDDNFLELVDAIRGRGQDSPILVRPHPDIAGHYQVAFGHRRLRAAKILGIPVKAIVKELNDKDHVIAQGQENSARADLSFIERSSFAHRLNEAGFDRETIMAALSVDKTTVSKMLSLYARIPDEIIMTVQAAHSVGRDRWHELSAKMNDQRFAKAALELIRQDRYISDDDNGRFVQLEKLSLSESISEQKPKTSIPEVRQWNREDGKLKAKIRTDTKGFSITLKSEQALSFGSFLERNLQRLYSEFEAEVKLQNNGD